MWILTRMILFSLRILAKFYYFGRKGNSETYIKINRNVGFYTRRNSQDIIILFEIWKSCCYKQAAVYPKNIVVDIGAHIGAYSILAAKKGAKVIAYEADRDNYKLLVKNIKANNCTTIRTHQKAVSSKRGTIVFYVHHNGTSLNSIYNDKAMKEKIDVASVDLHNIFLENKLKRIDVLKIDTEGAEYEILLHSKKQDMRHIKTIILEYHDYLNHGHSVSELIEFLEKSGFSVRNISHGINDCL